MATGNIKKPPRSNVTEITEWANGWTNNGQSYWSAFGNEVHVHASIRNGTTTSGIQIANFGSYHPISVTLTPVFTAVGAANGYAQINADGTLRLYNVSSADSVTFDLFWMRT